MRKAPGIFGQVEVGYGVPAIMRSFADAYSKARADYDLYMKVYREKNDAAMLPRVFASQCETFRSGTIAVVMAVTALDQSIYRYACHYIHHEDVETLIRNMGFVRKWIAIPKEAQGKKIDEQDPAILSLGELVAARNAIIHQKVGWITDEGMPPENKEAERFNRVASELNATYDACIALLG